MYRICVAIVQVIFVTVSCVSLVTSAENLRFPAIFSDTGKSEVLKAEDAEVKSVGFFHVFRKPPWGGGNQFLLALAGEFRRRGVKVLDNEITKDNRLYMANAITFKTEPFRKAARTRKSGPTGLKLVHRLDGPYYCSRFDKDPRLLYPKDPWRAKEDDRVFEINKEFACASIFQSQWSYEMNLHLGYKPKEPVTIINNAVDEVIFHNRSRLPWDPTLSRRIKIISSSWSAGARKGFDTFKWLDDNLDFTRYEYTFIGNVPEGFKVRNIKILPPVGSEELAPILRNHDIYIAASFLEPCSNALLESMACGLPTIFQDGSGHNELVKEAGFKYRTPEEIPNLLEILVSEYSIYQSKISYMTIAEVADKYLAVYKRCLKT